MKFLLFFVSIFLFTSYAVHPQSVNAPLNKDYYHTIDRYEIKQGMIADQFHTSMKPYRRSDIAGFVQSLRQQEINPSASDQFNIDYLERDNWEWVAQHTNTSDKPIFKHFYKVKSDLYHVDTEDFNLHVNPVIYFSGGYETSSDINTYTNTRGVQLRGHVSKKIGFYSFLGENQAVFPAYVRNVIDDQLIVPHEGFWKRFEENGVDFFTARGYISFEVTKNINLQFGHDQFNIGNGERSLILSDYAPAFLFLKLNTRVWKLNYTNLYTQLTADVLVNESGSLANEKYPNKYMTLHHLSVNVGKNLNIGLFESVIFDVDSAENSGFELAYLNPIIFYRAIEQQQGSVDNALLGLDFKWNLFRRFSLYGQLVFDEFLLDRIREGEGWWGNKFAIQFGGKYIDAFGLRNLDLQLEGNITRPYTYSHGSDYGSYSHYRQSLAHPLGANFGELVATARYQPMDKLNIIGKIIYADFGTDTTGVNNGGDILKDNDTRAGDFGHSIGQGIGNQLLLLDLRLSYQIKHNLFIDISQVFRRRESDLDLLDEDTSHTALSLRWNIPKRLHEF